MCIKKKKIKKPNMLKALNCAIEKGKSAAFYRTIYTIFNIGKEKTKPKKLVILCWENILYSIHLIAVLEYHTITFSITLRNTKQ